MIGAISLWNSGNGETEADRHIIEGSTTILNPKGDFHEDGARADAATDIGASSFIEVGDTSTCTEDCSGHDAGFEWAKENGVTDTSECGGRSSSFIEGCESFAQAIQEQVDDQRTDYEDGGSEEDNISTRTDRALICLPGHSQLSDDPRKSHLNQGADALL